MYVYIYAETDAFSNSVNFLYMSKEEVRRKFKGTEHEEEVAKWVASHPFDGRFIKVGPFILLKASMDVSRHAFGGESWYVDNE
jgi:hypothetical protein